MHGKREIRATFGNGFDALRFSKGIHGKRSAL
ncbi:hypothetical protein NB231_04085 [Nitrococcus mobilis Nb-231]|uniref:Uncharacterized protein n=1 Tax=Nitrococcus mobilis Nb-231 TaxID=314278 RepID=A4BPQ1_9GAMM|nr:hypothetical protein NB231_04085 [Nitrococcus mobilis Nb-231]